MRKYIMSKSINEGNTNNIKDLEGIGKVIWEFILAFYDAHWDSLYVDDSKILFRNKVKSKFNPQTTKTLVNNESKEGYSQTYLYLSSSPSYSGKNA